MMFTKADVSTSDDQIDKLTRGIQYLLKILYWIIDLFVIHKSIFEFFV